MAFKYYLDGQLTDTPVSDKELSTSIKRDRTTKILSITQDAELVYNGNNNLQPNEISGYEYLKNAFETQICNEVELVILDEVSDTLTYHLYTGVIKIPSIRIEYQELLLTTKVQDKGFYSYINNNKSVTVDLSSLFTKSQVPLDPINWYTVDLYNQTTCTYGSINNYYYKGFKITDVFEFVINYISDKKLKFQSNFLDSLTEKPFLFSGQALANSFTFYPNAQEPVIKITFAKLFEELSKIYNLVLYIDSTDLDNPIVRIEDSISTYQQSIGYVFTDIKEMKSSIDVQSLFAVVDVGSQEFFPVDSTFTPVLPFPPSRDYYGWKIEEYTPLGQCNIESRLNLINDWIIDTNIIWSAINLAATDYFDDIFLIECSNIDEYNKTADGHQFDFFGDLTCTYNRNLNNFNKLERFRDEFESAVGTNYSSFSNGFRASLTSNLIFEANPALPLGGTFLPHTLPAQPQSPVIVQPVVFGDITTGLNYDDGNNYNESTGVYTIPADGNYSFTFVMDFDINGIFGSLFTNLFFVSMVIRHYNSSNVQISQTGQTFTYGPVPSNNANHINTINHLVNGFTGDYVVCGFAIAYISDKPTFIIDNVFIKQNSYFECTGTPNGVPVPLSGFQSVNKYFFEFEYNIPESDWLNLTKNITKTIQFEKDGLIRYGWIEAMKHNDWDGNTQIKLITNNATYTQ